MRKETVILVGVGAIVGALLLPAPAAAQPETLSVIAGKVGINTSAPKGTLHLFSAAGADVFAGMGPDPDSPSGPAMNYGYCGGNCGVDSGFFNVRNSGGGTGRNPALLFMTSTTSRMVIDNQGYLGLGTNLGFTSAGFDPAHPIHHSDSGAHLSAAGVWTNGSSRAMKSNISPLSEAQADQALEELLPVNYTHTASGLSQVGFIAEDVPELVASPDRQGVSSMDIVAVLTRVLKDQRAQIAALEARLATLETNTN